MHYKHDKLLAMIISNIVPAKYLLLQTGDSFHLSISIYVYLYLSIFIYIYLYLSIYFYIYLYLSISIYIRDEIDFNFRIVLLEKKRINSYGLFNDIQEKNKSFQVLQTKSFYLYMDPALGGPREKKKEGERERERERNREIDREREKEIKRERERE